MWLRLDRALTYLNLRHLDGIGIAGMSAIGRALGRNHGIITIHVHGSSLGDEGAAAWAEGMEQNRVLISIELDGCLLF